jgi:hypothetical protein
MKLFIVEGEKLRFKPLELQELVNEAYYYVEKRIVELKDQGRTYVTLDGGGTYTYVLSLNFAADEVPGFINHRPPLLEEKENFRLSYGIARLLRMADGLKRLDIRERVGKQQVVEKLRPDSMIYKINLLYGDQRGVGRLRNCLISAMSYWGSASKNFTIQEFLIKYPSSALFARKKGVGQKSLDLLSDFLMISEGIVW